MTLFFLPQTLISGLKNIQFGSYILLGVDVLSQHIALSLIVIDLHFSWHTEYCTLTFECTLTFACHYCYEYAEHDAYSFIDAFAYGKSNCMFAFAHLQLHLVIFCMVVHVAMIVHRHFLSL